MTVKSRFSFGFARRLLVAVIAVGAVCGTRAAEKWLLGRSEHFEMLSSATEPESKRMLVALEQFRANFITLFPLTGASEPRTSLVVFGHDSEFRPYKPLYEGKPKDVAGFFLPSPDEAVIAMTTDVPNEESDPREVIYHEYVHLLLHVRDTKYPLWLDEGLAEVFSTFSLEDGKMKTGAVKKSHVALLQHSALLPLAKLFAVSHESPDYNEEDRANIFYAESWAFVHYLLYGQDTSNAEKLASFVKRILEGADVETSFRAAFGTDYKALDLALRGYLTAGSYYKRGKEAAADGLQPAFRAASDTERDAALLNLQWRVHRNADAAGRALALREKAPREARIHELLAAIAAESGDLAAAQDHWVHAADCHSGNAWIYVQLLREALSPFKGAALLDTRLGGDRIIQLRRWASHALARQPENAEALELAATVEAIADQMDFRNVNLVQTNLGKMRDPGQAMLALAIVHWRGDDPKGARDLIGLVQSLPRADMAMRAAAAALRARLPVAAEEVSRKSTATGKPIKAGITLQTNRVSEAAKLLDRLLVERITTAPVFKLPTVEVRAGDTELLARWTAVDELRKRAAAGDPNAMFDLAIAHALGIDAEFSPTLATAWLQKALDRGHPLAQQGIAASKLDPELVVQFLRGQKTPPADTPLPPLPRDLKTRIAESAAAAERSDLVVIFKTPPHYPDALRRAGKSGTVTIICNVDAEGQPKQVQATEISDPAFGNAAEACVRQWRFVPTIRDAEPASTLVAIPIVFNGGAASLP